MPAIARFPRLIGGPALALAVLAVLAVSLGLAGEVAAQPTEADVYVGEGTVALDDKRYEAAIESFRRALEREPDHVEALYYTGLTYLALGKPDAALPFLERAHARSPQEAAVGYQLGLAYLALHQDDKAAPLLEAAFAQEPTLDGLGYYAGLLRYRKGDYQGALKAFRATRAADPEIAQLTRLYTGMSLAALGLSAQGAEEIDRALRLQPASALTAPAERLRADLLSRGEQRRFRAGARLGFYTDDNARAAPNAATDSTVTNLRHARMNTTGELFSLTADYDWLRRDAWTATVGYSFFTTYNNDLPNLNLIDNQATLGVSRRDVVGDMPLESGLYYSFEYLLLDTKELLERHTIAASATLSESAMHLTNVVGRVEVKDFGQSPPYPHDEKLDATNWMVGALHLVRFSRGRHFVKLGYQYDIEDADGQNFSYHGHRVIAGAQYTLPWLDIRLSYDFDVHLRDYDNRNSIFPENRPRTVTRSDQDYTQVARVAVPLGGPPKWGTFSLVGEYLRKDVDSNLAVYRYTRDVFSLSVLWRY